MAMGLMAVQAPQLMPQIWQRSKELGRDSNTERKPGKKKTEKQLRDKGWSCALEKSQTRGQREETRGNGVSDSTEAIGG